MALSVQQLLTIVSEECHALLGFLFVLLPAFLFPGNVLVLAGSIGIELVIEIPKEFWWDVQNEQGATWKSGALDLAFYLVGNAIGVLFLVAVHRPF